MQGVELTHNMAFLAALVARLCLLLHRAITGDVTLEAT